MNQTRQVVRLSAVQLNKSGNRYLSITTCSMKDLKVGDSFYMLESDQELVVDKDGCFLFKAESIPKPHKDTYIVKVRELK